MSFMKVMYVIPSLLRLLSFSNHERILAFVKSFLASVKIIIWFCLLFCYYHMIH